MFFEATLKGQKYKIDVDETSTHWKISLQQGNQEWVHYNLSKTDYQVAEETISLLFKNQSYLIDVVSDGVNYDVYTRGSYRSIKVFNDEMLFHETLKKGGSVSSEKELKSGMPGKIIRVMVKEGQKIKAGEPLLVMEAMKMENEIRSTQDEEVKKILVKEGEAVEKGTALVKFK